MSFADIITAVSTLGFPIAACVYFMWQNKIQDARNAAQIDKMNDILQ